MTDTTSTTTALVPVPAVDPPERIRARARHPTARAGEQWRTLRPVEGETVDQFAGATRVAVVIEQVPQPVNLVIYGGDDVAFALDVTNPDGTPADLTGAETQSQVRPADPTDPTVFDLTADLGVPPSTVVVTVPATVTAGLPAKAVWDIKIRRAGWTSTLAAGTVATTAAVTVWQ